MNGITLNKLKRNVSELYEAVSQFHITVPFSRDETKKHPEIFRDIIDSLYAKNTLRDNICNWLTSVFIELDRTAHPDIVAYSVVIATHYFLWNFEKVRLIDTEQFYRNLLK